MKYLAHIIRMLFFAAFVLLLLNGKMLRRMSVRLPFGALLAPRAREKLQRIDNDFYLTATLTVLFPAVLSQFADDRYLPAPLQILVYGFGTFTEHRAVEEVCFILPAIISRPLSPVDC